MRREERVTVQGPVKEQRPDGMSHRGGHIPPHSAQPQHTNYWAPRTRKRHQQEHRPQRPTEGSDPTQHAKGRTGDCPGPRKGATTRRNVTQGGGEVWGGPAYSNLIFPQPIFGAGGSQSQRPPPLINEAWPLGSIGHSKTVPQRPFVSRRLPLTPPPGGGRGGGGGVALDRWPVTDEYRRITARGPPFCCRMGGGSLWAAVESPGLGCSTAQI